VILLMKDLRPIMYWYLPVSVKLSMHLPKEDPGDPCSTWRGKITETTAREHDNKRLD
jgi:hypothetical protein